MSRPIAISISLLFIAFAVGVQIASLRGGGDDYTNAPARAESFLRLIDKWIATVKWHKMANERVNVVTIIDSLLDRQQYCTTLKKLAHSSILHDRYKSDQMCD